MYRYLIRPLLFLLNPETIHHLLICFLKMFFRIPVISKIISAVFCYRRDSLKTDFLGLTFENPVGLAAGFDKNAETYNELSHFGFSFIEIGTVTPEYQKGNHKPRSFRIPKDKGLINRMGLNNKGVLFAVNQLIKRPPKTIIGGNIGKNTRTPNNNAIEDYVYAFNTLYKHVHYLVINLSCPNVKNLNELQDKEKTVQIVTELEKERNNYNEKKPILLKISPDLTASQLDDVIDIYYKTGIDGIIATNTTTIREGLHTAEKHLQSIGEGGLSGKPLNRLSNECIRYIAEKSNHEIPLIGVGGIMSVEDALEKIRAGATLIQIYTGFIYNGPHFVKQLNKAIYNRRQKQQD